jgi:membrane protein involved in colicin uptake
MPARFAPLRTTMSSRPRRSRFGLAAAVVGLIAAGTLAGCAGNSGKSVSATGVGASLSSSASTSSASAASSAADAASAAAQSQAAASTAAARSAAASKAAASEAASRAAAASKAAADRAAADRAAANRAAASRAAASRAAASSAAPPADNNCTPGYSPCIPPGSDVDCEGGSGNGPRYVAGPVTVTGSDPYRLDSDHDGIGCE